MTKQRLQKWLLQDTTLQGTKRWLLLLAVTLLATGLLLVMAIIADIDSRNDTIKLRDEKINSLNKQLEDELINHDIDRGKLDVVCENHPVACQGVE